MTVASRPNSSQLDLTLEALRAHPDWRLVLLKPKAKKPEGNMWEITADPDRITRHVERGGNLGLLCHEDTGVVVLDSDDAAGWDALTSVLGPLVPWVQTGSGKKHFYCAWAKGLPAKIVGNGKKLGEIQRGPGQQHVVLPPSIHPDTGQPYTWLVNPCDALPEIPSQWLAYLSTPEENGTGKWVATPHVLESVLKQPGAVQRQKLVKFQCPACRDEGHDLHQDNACYFIEDGKFGCAYDGKGHWRRVGTEIGAITEPSAAPDEYLSELGNSRRLVRMFGDRLRYVSAWKTWLVWTGTHWDRQSGNDTVRQYALKLVDQLYYDAAKDTDPDRRKRLASFANLSQTSRAVRGMIELATADPSVCVRPEAFDSDHWLLNCENGTVDLRTGVLYPHRQDDLITRCAPSRYEPDAACPMFEAFLARVLPVESIRQYVQKAAGYSATGNTREQCLFLATGDGANGKTTLLLALTGALGAPYCQGLSINTLLSTKYDSGALNDLATLEGIRFVTAVEPDMGRRLAESIVKQVTGGEPIKVKRLYQDVFLIQPRFKLWLATNHKPVIRGTDLGIWRRIKTIEFGETIPKSEQVSDYHEVLLAKERAGILAWIVRGCLAWQRDGLVDPDGVTAATAAYRADMDAFGGFLKEECWAGPGVVGGKAELYEAYRTWAKASGEKEMTKTAFGIELRRRGFEAGKTKEARVVRGLRLREPGDPEAGSVTGLGDGDRFFTNLHAKELLEKSSGKRPLNLSPATNLSPGAALHPGEEAL